MREEIIDTKEIEEKAINYLKRFIEDSKVISQYIMDNDKGPCWDGYFILHSGGRKDKDHQLGRVPIQIKGTMVDQFSTKKWKFKLEKNDLKAYLHEPTFFFVCQIKKGSKERKLYFREFLPITVRKLLTDMGANESRMTVFHPLTENLQEFEQQLILFMNNSRKMLSFADKTPLTMEQVAERGIKDFSFVAPIMEANKLKLFQYLSTHETYLYAKPLKDLDIEIPISDGPMRFAFMKELDIDIKVGDTVFFRGCNSKVEYGRITLTIGNILTLEMPLSSKSHQNGELKFKSQATSLDDSIREAEFSIALHRTGILTLGDVNINMKIHEIETIKELETKLEHWKELQLLLRKLHVTKSLDLSGITKEQGRYIEILVNSILKDKTVNLPGQASTLILFELSNIKLLLWCVAENNGDCKFGSFCDQNIGILYDFEGENIMISPYSYLQNNNLWEKSDNINYEEIIPSIKKVCRENKFCFKLAIHDVLALISASDNLKTSDREKCDKLLDAAKQLCQWLDSNDPDEENKVFHFINKMQIIKRQRELSKYEISDLEYHLQSVKISNMGKAGISLLLENKLQFEYFYSVLSNDEKKEIEQYPIWKFKDW